jgi:beta-galactosidase/beta-glucuronidase
MRHAGDGDLADGVDGARAAARPPLALDRARLRPLAIDVPDAKPWSPESPHLYDLRLELLDAKEGVIDRVGSYAGRRRVHLENGRFRLNNRPIFLRHRNHPPIIAWTPWNEVCG